MDWKEFFKPTITKLILFILVFLLIPLPYFHMFCPQTVVGEPSGCFPASNIVPLLSIILNGYEMGSMTPVGIHYISLIEYITAEYWSWISLLINLLISYIAACFIIKIYHRFKNK